MKPIDSISPGAGLDATENNLRAIRESEGLSQGDLSALSNVSIDTISDAENGRRPLSQRLRQKIANGLNANPNKVSADHRYTVDEVFPISAQESEERNILLQRRSVKTIVTRIPADVHRRIKVHCVMNGVTLESFVAAAITEKLQRDLK
jgi:transcriptional regulator with XRE-family HTH domain